MGYAYVQVVPSYVPRITLFASLSVRTPLLLDALPVHPSLGIAEPLNVTVLGKPRLMFVFVIPYHCSKNDSRTPPMLVFEMLIDVSWKPYKSERFPTIPLDFGSEILVKPLAKVKSPMSPVASLFGHESDRVLKLLPAREPMLP